MTHFLPKTSLIYVIFFLSNLFLTISASDEIVRVRLESCPGCQLNRLSEIKSFVYEDFPKYENAEFKKIQGAPPELLFLNENDDVVERHSLKPLTRNECNELMESKGFKKIKHREF